MQLGVQHKLIYCSKSSKNFAETFLEEEGSIFEMNQILVVIQRVTKSMVPPSHCGFPEDTFWMACCNQCSNFGSLIRIKIF